MVSVTVPAYLTGAQFNVVSRDGKMLFTAQLANSRNDVRLTHIATGSYIISIVKKHNDTNVTHYTQCVTID
jgi:hypothetical protein